MRGAGPNVICMGGADAREPQERLEAFWSRLENEGWLGFRGPHNRVVLQIARAGRSAAVVAMGRSLAARIARLVPGIVVEIVDAMGSAKDWGSLRVRRIAQEESFRVAGVAVTQGVRIPALWLESYALVTVTGVSPSTTSRVASVLEAQAEPLFELGNTGAAAALVYEAHRLAASDLAVVCCESDGTMPRACAASPDDVALEHAVLTAAGVVAIDAPHVRELLRHEIAPPAPHVDGTLPALRAFAMPRRTAERAALGARVRASGHALAHDMRNLQGNLHKIPAFVRRRVQTWRSQRSAS